MKTAMLLVFLSIFAVGSKDRYPASKAGDSIDGIVRSVGTSHGT